MLRPASSPAGHPRPGLSLIEVLVSLAIFLMSLAGLAYLLTIAGNHALEAQYRSEAAQLAQSKLAEVQAGAVPLQSGGGSFDDEPDYHWSLEAQQGSVQGLWNVTVRVQRQRPDGSQVEVALSQMVLDPSGVGSTQDVPPADTTTAAPSSSTPGSSSSTPSTSTPSGR